MKYDLSIIQDYIDRGLLEKNDHPTLPLSIFNYSRECQFTSAWDDITLNMRGTILDREGNIIARSFPKFFNMEEMKDIPNESFEVFEKMDGSLGIIFYYDHEWHIATRGSFVSDQAIEAKRLFDEKYGNASGSHLWTKYTYLVEIIYPENRIVCQYNESELVLLAAFNTETGHELTHWDLNMESMFHGFRVVDKYDGINDFKELKKNIANDHEGFVVRFKSGLRMKIKGEEYVRLHRLLTNFSNVDIWKCLKDSVDMKEFLERVPDEFDAWVKNTIQELKYKFFQIHEHCGKTYQYFCYGKYGDVDPKPSKKEFALWLNRLDEHPACKSVMFAMYDGKKYDHIIWTMVRPTYSKPFWNKQDDN